MKAGGRRPSVFVVFECLKILMKHEARVYEMVLKRTYFINNKHKNRTST